MIKVSSRKTADLDGLCNELNQPNIKVVLYFFSVEFANSSIQTAIKKKFPQAVCAGASMVGGWCTSGSLEKGIIAMSLSDEEVEDAFVMLQEGVQKNPDDAAQKAVNELSRKYNYQALDPDKYLGILLIDGFCLAERIVHIFNEDERFNIPFIGGAAADEMTFTKTFVSANNQISGDGFVTLVMKMKIPFYYNHYVHYLPTRTSFMVTKADPTARIIAEINGQPAAPYFAKLIGIPSVDQLTFDIFSKHPVGIIINNTVYLRSSNRVIDGTKLLFNTPVETGTKLFMLEQGDIIDNARKAVREAESYIPHLQGAIFFNCVFRYLELKDDNKIDAFNDVFKHLSFIGFNTFGEELFTHHNQTLTAVFFGKGDKNDSEN
ncbi:hypothetical protein FACS1894164_07100 [Spirochaetia bacterium]|nr:hypothetical protein FACS1894164_07100 [Spirochaetia bacterium]